MARAFLSKYKGKELFLAATSHFYTTSRVYFDDRTGAITHSIDFDGDDVVLLASAAGSDTPQFDQFADEKHDVIFKSKSLGDWIDNLLIKDKVYTSRPHEGS